MSEAQSPSISVQALSFFDQKSHLLEYSLSHRLRSRLMSILRDVLPLPPVLTIRPSLLEETEFLLRIPAHVYMRTLR
jgi:hypothetical protein